MSTSSESALIIKRLTLKVCYIMTFPALHDSLESDIVSVYARRKTSTGFSTSSKSNESVRHYRRGESDPTH